MGINNNANPRCDAACAIPAKTSAVTGSASRSNPLAIEIPNVRLRPRNARAACRGW
jgi:hypothetical protein